MPRRPRDCRLHGPGAAALALTLVAGSLAGCGGGGTSSTGGSSSSTTSAQATTPRSQSTTSTNGNGGPAALGSPKAVRAAVEAVLTSTNPADACGKYVTEHYLKVAYGGRQGCVQAQAPGSAAKSLRSLRIVNEGTQATLVIATAVPTGGPYDGSKVGVRLFFSHERYRVDALHANVPVGP